MKYEEQKKIISNILNVEEFQSEEFEYKRVVLNDGALIKTEAVEELKRYGIEIWATSTTLNKKGQIVMQLDVKYTDMPECDDCGECSNDLEVYDDTFEDPESPRGYEHGYHHGQKLCKKCTIKNDMSTQRMYNEIAEEREFKEQNVEL